MSGESESLASKFMSGTGMHSGSGPYRSLVKLELAGAPHNIYIVRPAQRKRTWPLRRLAKFESAVRAILGFCLEAQVLPIASLILGFLSQL